MKTYTSTTGQSLYDICLMVYGTLDNFIKFCNDNNQTDMNAIPDAGTVFYYDPNYAKISSLPTTPFITGVIS